MPEEHLAELHLDMDATVHVRAFPDRPFPARVTHIASDLDPDSRTVQVRASVDNPGGVLKTGMYATIALRSRDVRRTLVVPEAAVQHLAEDPFVFRPPGRRQVSAAVGDAGPDGGFPHRDRVRGRGR